jgi:hypothetical protein
MIGNAANVAHGSKRTFNDCAEHAAHGSGSAISFSKRTGSRVAMCYASSVIRHAETDVWPELAGLFDAPIPPISITDPIEI